MSDSNNEPTQPFPTAPYPAGIVPAGGGGPASDEAGGAPAASAPTGGTAGSGTAGSGPVAGVPAADVVPAPTIRWAGVVWGALFCAFGITVMALVSTAANRLAYARWVDGLGPAGAGLVAVIALGVFLLIVGVLSAARRAQRPRS